jgi:hypothetical protein
MKQRFFEVTGQLVDAAGNPMQDILLSVLDSDDYADDLIGVGTPTSDGRFCVSFTREAFNQDWFENEDLPDLYIVVSKLDDEGTPTAFFQKEYPGRTFVGGKEDLAKIVVTDDSPATTAKGSVIYDFSNVRRVDVDDEVIAHVLEAVTQRVQAVTGWDDVAKGVPIKQTYELLSVIQGITAGAIGKEKELPWWTELHQRVQKSVLGGIAAVYDPFDREVWLDHGLLGQAGLDIMKASVAHELVHAGQFDHYPDLVNTYRTSLIAHDLRMRYGVRKDPSEPMPEELIQQLLPSFVFMCNLEGYARYVEKQFFACAHTCQRYVPQIRLGLIMGTAPVLSLANLTSETVHAPVVSADATQQEKAAAWLTSLDPLVYKAEQYGCDQWYSARQKGDAPVPFSATLGDELLAKVTEYAAKMWDER